MPTLGQRMFKLKQLLGIRLGPGAAVLPKDVKKISMRFAPKIDDGHRGPKKFVKTMLPRLQYRNPALPIKVDRRAAQSDPAVMNVTFDAAAPLTAAAKLLASTTSSTTTQPQRPGELVVTLHMKGKTEREILEQLYEVTGATEIEPTAVEKDELREIEERKARSRIDSERQAEINRARKREAAMLAAARGSVGMTPE